MVVEKIVVQQNCKVTVSSFFKSPVKIIFSQWVVWITQEQSSSTFQPGTGENLCRILTSQKFTHLQPFSMKKNFTSSEVKQRTKFYQWFQHLIK